MDRAVGQGTDLLQILVVEDWSELIKGHLKHGGHAVRQAFDGTDALRVAQEFGPELVVLD